MIMSDLKGKIWMNGKLVEWSDAKIHVLTHTLHYGTGVFEGVRAYETPDGPAIFRLEDHTNRLFESAKLIGMQIPYDAKELNDAQSQVVKINNLKNAQRATSEGHLAKIFAKMNNKASFDRTSLSSEVFLKLRRTT